MTGDSIRTCFLRLSDSMDRSFSDILQIKDRTNPFRNDTSLLLAGINALSFYDSFGNIKLRPKEKSESISSYREFLSAVVSEGIHTNDDLYRFIKIEDVLFRGFLDHLLEYGDQSLSDILFLSFTIWSGRVGFWVLICFEELSWFNNILICVTLLSVSKICLFSARIHIVFGAKLLIIG